MGDPSRIQDGKRRVLWISHFPVFGGPHNLMLRLAGPLEARGWQVDVLLPAGEGSAYRRLQEAGLEVVTMPLHRLRASRDPREHLSTAAQLAPEVRRIRALVRERDIDVVVIGGLSTPHGAIAGRRAGAAVVWQVLDTRLPPIPRRALMETAYRLADVLMFTGEAVRAAHMGRRRTNVSTSLFTGVCDTESLRPDRARRAELRRTLGVPDDSLMMGTISNINPQKGILDFVRAAAQVHRARPDARFLILGSTYDTHRGYLGRVHAEIARSGVPEDAFILTGERLHDQYLALDVKTITSVPRSEGTPTTAIEAMACGVPVVATDVGATAEIVEDQVTGLIVPPRDPGKVAEGVLRIAADPPLAREMGERARERAVERFGLDVVADAHHRAFCEALELARARRRRTASTEQT